MNKLAIFIELIMIYLYYTYHISLINMVDSHRLYSYDGGSGLCASSKVKVSLAVKFVWLLSVCGVYLYQVDGTNILLDLSEFLRFYVFWVMVFLILVCFIEVFIYFIVLKLFYSEYFNWQGIYDIFMWMYTICVIALPMLLCTVKFGIETGTWLLFYIVEMLAAIILYIFISS